MTEGQRLGIQPYRRPDDENVDGIIQRYKLLYSDNFAKIISIYQLRAMAQVFTVDGHETPDQVWDDIQLYLKTFCGEEI